MGKSLKGKELGRGISQRKNGTYQGRFTDRFQNRHTVYAKTYNEIRHKLRDAEYENDKRINIKNEKLTLDEWYEIWVKTYKQHCRNSTLKVYENYYKRIKADLGWIMLSNLNLHIMQETLNKLGSDNIRKYTKMILADMLEKAVDSELVIKNHARKLKTVLTDNEKKERRVLTIDETNIFLEAAKGRFYYNLFVLALETGMRIGELCGLMWSDIDLDKKVLYVNRTLCYLNVDGKRIFDIHKPKTKSGQRVIPLTQKAVEALERQKIQKQMIIFKGNYAEEKFSDLVFVTGNNKPTQDTLIKSCIDLVVKKIQKTNKDFESLSPHTFRHTFATRAIENGIQPKSLQKLLGHASLKMTMDLYCHVTDETLFDEMQKMEKMA